MESHEDDRVGAVGLVAAVVKPLTVRPPEHVLVAKLRIDHQWRQLTTGQVEEVEVGLLAPADAVAQSGMATVCRNREEVDAVLELGQHHVRLIATRHSVELVHSGGKGRVAALKKGKTGDNQVMAMVTASLNKKVKIQGGMSREAVKKVIDMHMDEISHCYETALVDNPSIVGRVVFEWKILLSGRVGEVRIKNSSINSDYIHSCIQSRIKSWQFPKPQGSEVMVSYPFIFDIVGF